MKKGLAMTRLTQGALVSKCTAAVMSAFLFITPAVMAQLNAPDSVSGNPATDVPATNTSDKGSLTFASGGGSVPAAKADPAASEATTAKTDSLDGKSAEVNGAAAGADDGTALAQSSGAPASRRLDPAYTRLPRSGDIKVRRAFKLFAKEELIHNLSFRDTPIKEVLGELARKGNLNIILDKSVIGKVTGDLHDVTMNEAMDAVLAAAGLQSRVLDSNTCIVAMPNSLAQLGLNRTHSKVFKLNYISPYEASAELMASVFFKGYLPDFNATVRSRNVTTNSENPKGASSSKEESASQGIGEGGVPRKKEAREESSNATESKDENEAGGDYSFATRLDSGRQVRTSRINLQEGTGYNNASQDPGTLQIRAFQEVADSFTVENNGGGAIVIPDSRNRQVIVVGTPDDLAVAEECIHFIDKRPRQIHVQVSLVELNNSGIRQLGASLNLQGQGASGALLGGSGAPLINALPGLGSSVTNSSSWALTPDTTGVNGLMGFGSKTTLGQTLATNILPYGSPNPMVGTFTATQSSAFQPTPVTAPAGTYNGILGGFFPGILNQTIAGVTSAATSTSNLNLLALSKAAGGRTNIATMPYGLNLSINLLLQQNKAKILANPSVVVSDNTEALVTLATEVIHKVTSTVSLGVTNTNVELTKAGIFLDVLPKCTDDGFIYMRIRPQVSAPVGPPQQFANQTLIVTLLNIREIMAQEVRVKDGQTLVLGGLFTEQEAAQISKVPYLAETPLFGALFRNTLKGRQRTELMLMITPKIVEEQPAVPTMPENLPQANL